MSTLDDLPIDPARDTSASAFSTETSRPSWAPLALLVLAITGLGGANAGKEATNNNIYAANQYAFLPGQEHPPD